MIFLGTVYQILRVSLYHKSASAAQTNSMDLRKRNKVISNIKEWDSSKKYKIKTVIRSAPFTGNTQEHSSDTD